MKNRKPRVQKYTTENFIEKAKLIHGDIYDYSKTEYTGIKNKLIIICKIHGEFIQTADNHLCKNGCLKCGRIRTIKSRIIDKEIILRKFKEIHNDRYDYSKAEIVDTKTKIEIICKIHGSFFQTAEKHIHQKSGCPRCGKLQGGRCKHHNFINSKDGFIKLFNEKYNYKYDYSLMELIHPKVKFKIICPIHGIFEQNIEDHRVNGCRKCGNIHGSEKRKILQEDIIIRFKEIHGDIYDYSKFEYKGIFDKSIIICNKHGEFLQTANSHSSGSGCIKCNATGTYSWSYFSNDNRKNKKAYLYLIKFENEEEKFYKIGITIRKPNLRFYKNEAGYKITQIFSITNTLYETFKCEQYLLQIMLKNDRYIPKTWFGGHFECFYVDENNVEAKLNQIKKYMENNNINI